MNFRKFLFSIICLSMFLGVGSILLLTMQAKDDVQPTNDVSVDDVLNLMSTAHTAYEQIHVRYNINSGGEDIQHEVWLDNSSREFRREITRSDGEQILEVSNGSSMYMDEGLTGEPMTQDAFPPTDEITYANQALGGIGTFIAPIIALEGRLSQSRIMLAGIEEYNNESLSEPLSVAYLVTQLVTEVGEFPPADLWIDLETGIIVQEIIYNENGVAFSISTLEMIEFNPEIDPDLFTVGES